jgi:F-box protein 21
MRLSDIVSRIYRDRPDITELTPREKAVSIADYLQVNNLTGLEPGTEFYRVEHNFLGMALTSDGHNSLPLISAAIYCYVARIFGLNANPCGFPFHVHVIIRPDPGYDLDGNCLENGEDAAPMYMDPFRSREETPVSELEAQLNFLGVLTLTHSSHPTFLRESRTPEIILRCANNISESLSQTLRYRHSSIDASLAKYATHWLFMLFADYAGVDENLHGGPTPRQIARLQLGRHLPYLMDLFVTKYPLDVYLIEQYIIPLFRGLPEYEHLLETVRVMKAGDGIPKQVRRRTFENRNLRYRVGQVFRHRRYGYLAVVIGWDTACGTEERWMHRMGADQHRARGRQSLYHAL